MRVAARTVLLVIATAVAINFLQGGPERVKRWSVRTLTGKDLSGPSSAGGKGGGKGSGPGMGLGALDPFIEGANNALQGLGGAKK